MEKCDKCGEYNFNDKACNCEPFQVFYPEYYGDEKETVYGFSHRGVVEKIAREINLDEYIFDTDIFETPVEVTDENGITKSFNCVAIVDVNYLAKEIEE